VPSSIAISRLALLTPFGPALNTWTALCGDRRLSDHTAIGEELLDPDIALDRSIRLALAVANRIAPPADTALFCGTSKGPVTTLLSALDTLAAGGTLGESQARHVALGVGAMGPLLGERLGLTGATHTSVAACSSGLHALHRAARAVAHGECRRALVVAADASMHPLFTGSFARLGVLAPADAEGRRWCEPFGDSGEGFFLTEAAAALLIERSPVEPPLAWVEQTAIAADATDLIAIDPQTRSLRAALRRAAGDGPLAFVHAHATGTGHDAHERAAISAIAGGDVPVFSHKRWLGHSLGAAGLVSIALSALAHHHGRTPTGAVVPAGGRSLTIAQGFGGHIAIVALSGSLSPTEHS
jgi:3-oxoacyl-(acyl-carrier-protein) synthase